MAAACKAMVVWGVREEKPSSEDTSVRVGKAIGKKSLRTEVRGDFNIGYVFFLKRGTPATFIQFLR